MFNVRDEERVVELDKGTENGGGEGEGGMFIDGALGETIGEFEVEEEEAVAEAVVETPTGDFFGRPRLLGTGVEVPSMDSCCSSFLTDTSAAEETLLDRRSWSSIIISSSDPLSSDEETGICINALEEGWWVMMLVGILYWKGSMLGADMGKEKGVQAAEEDTRGCDDVGNA